MLEIKWKSVILETHHKATFASIGPFFMQFFIVFLCFHTIRREYFDNIVLFLNLIKEVFGNSQWKKS